MQERKLPFDYISSFLAPFKLPLMLLTIGLVIFNLSYNIPLLEDRATFVKVTVGISLFVITSSAVTASVAFLRGPIGSARDDLPNLQPSVSGKKLSETTTIRDINERIAKLEASNEDAQSAVFGHEYKISQDVLAMINNYTSDELIQKAKDKLENDLGSHSSREFIRDAFQDTRRRIGREVGWLRRSGTYNLAIGGAVSTAGMILLAYYLFSETKTQFSGDLVQIAVHYLPRLSLVVLIEFFSLFFLKLYKASLDDVRYFQNEMTNTEQRLVGFEIANSLDDQQALADLVHLAFATERNSTLKKGETTIALETAKIDSGAGAIAVLKAAVPILRKLEK